MDTEPSIDDTVMTSEHYKRSCFIPDFQSKWIKNKGAILVLVWSFLYFCVYDYFVFSSTSRDPLNQTKKINSGALVGMAVMLPIGGWLADAYFGRYRVIRCGLWVMWVGAMLNGLSLVVGLVVDSYRRIGDPWVSFTSKVTMGIGFGAFQANIIPFGIDQLIDAPSTEVTAFIMWYTILVFFGSATVFYSSFCSGEYMAVLVVAVFLTLAICLNFFFHRHLNKEQVVSNPLPQILKIVLYTIKNRSRTRTMVYCNQRKVLSKFDIAKRLYNGPFSSEQVEDVKTFLRVITLVVTVTVLCGGTPTLFDVKDKLTGHLRNHQFLKGCYEMISVHQFQYTFPLVIVPVFWIFLHPLLCKCIPRVSITVKFSFSVLLLLASLLCLLGMESASYYYQTSSNTTLHKCIFQNTHFESNVEFYWILLPSALLGISVYTFILSGIEFICAQAPVNMKGLILGIACGLYGLTSVIQSLIALPFVSPGKHATFWENAPLSCGIWYFLIQVAVTFIGYLLVIAMVKSYQRRNRMGLLITSELHCSLSD